MTDTFDGGEHDEEPPAPVGPDGKPMRKVEPEEMVMQIFSRLPGPRYINLAITVMANINPSKVVPPPGMSEQEMATFMRVKKIIQECNDIVREDRDRRIIAPDESIN